MDEAKRLIRCGDPNVELTRGELRHQVSAGQVLRIRHGTHLAADAAEALDVLGRHRVDIAAALTAQSDVGVVSHTSAAVVHRLPIWNVSLDTVHLTKQRRNSGRRTTALHVHTAPLLADDVGTVDGVLVTSLARTLLDVACTVSFEASVVMVDAALHQRRINPQVLLDALQRARGRHGRARAVRVFDFADGRSESVGESRSRVGMHRAGVPVPGLQREIFRDDGRLLARTDFDWDWLIGEFDGREKYGRFRREGETPGDALAREKLREDELRDLGHDVIRWIWAELASAALYERISRAIARSASRTR